LDVFVDTCPALGGLEGGREGREGAYGDTLAHEEPKGQGMEVCDGGIYRGSWEAVISRYEFTIFFCLHR
jgi:hypothetical protein